MVIAISRYRVIN